jgi:bifunctional non-homologous end joining protein LigD
MGWIYVIQKHAATTLHYDFRLEVGGKLKSWAVPKGPSLIPAHKRLALQVEDHDLRHADFEGKIGEGRYGAGNVIIWDKGTYEPIPVDQEFSVAKRLENGLLEFKLDGKKLKGKWRLVKIKGKKRDWLLIKGNDEYARRAGDILRDRPESVVSGAITLIPDK